MKYKMRRLQRMAVLMVTACLLAGTAAAQDLRLPMKNGSLKIAIIGDSGTGDRPQYDIANKLTDYRRVFPFDLVLMLGDNMYGGEKPKDYNRKFEQPYKTLLDQGVKFYAALGNHDNPEQRYYKLFNMNGERFYTFRPKLGIRFFALDSNYMDRAQLEWLEKELKNSGSDWKIAFFHHPLYSSGARHGSDMALRQVLEPLFVKYGMDAVFAGHEHFYERVKPQKGIYYFISGGAAKLRKGNLRRTDMTAKGFDTDQHFMLVEIVDDMLYFQTISRTGETIDSGVCKRVRNEPRQQQAANGDR